MERKNTFMEPIHRRRGWVTGVAAASLVVSGLGATGAAQAAPEEPTLVVSRNRFYRIGRNGTAVLSRCDGRTTVGELMGTLPGAHAPEVCGFLLQMRRHGVIHFTHG